MVSISGQIPPSAIRVLDMSEGPASTDRKPRRVNHMSSFAKLSIILALVAVSQFAIGPDASAQGRRGGRGGWGGGDRGDRGGGFDRGGDRGRGGDRSGGGSSSRTEEFLKGLDTNHDGTIDADEAADPSAKMMLDRLFSRIGKEPHYPIAISEILEQYDRSRSNGGGSGQSPTSLRSAGTSSTTSSSAGGMLSPPGMGFGASGSHPASVKSPSSSSTPAVASTTSPTPAGMMAPPSGAAPPAAIAAAALATSSTPAPSSEDAKPRGPARFLTARERLPKGLPDWFVEKANSDGQVTMADYTKNWTQDAVAKFDRYDLNHDGVITAEECLRVEKGKSSEK